MKTQPNGQAAPVMTGPGPAPEEIAKQQAVLNKMDAPMRAVLSTMIRGLLTAFPGVRAHVIMTMVAAQTGELLGAALQGDLMMLMQIRKGFMDAFNEGVRRNPPNSGVMPPQGAAPPNLRG